MTITISNVSYTYLRDAINAAVDNTIILIGAGTYNILDSTAGLPQNANNDYCGYFAPSLSRFFSKQGGISGLTLDGAFDGVTGAPLATITNLTRIYAGAKDLGFGIPTNWTIRNLNLSFNFTGAEGEYILQGGNYGSTSNSLTGLTLRNVAFQGTHVGNKNSGTYCELIAANNLIFNTIRVGSDFGGQYTYQPGNSTTLSLGGSAFLFAQGSDMSVQNSTFVETRYGNTITFWGSTNASINSNTFDGDGQRKQRGQILSNTSGFVNDNYFVGGTHLDLLDVGGKSIFIGTNKFNATSLNSPLATVTKGVGIYIGNCQALSQLRSLTISGNQFTDVIPLVLDLSTAATGTNPAATAQFSFGSNEVYNPVTSSFTTFGRFIVGGTSADTLTGAQSPTRDDFISGAQGNDTLTGNGGSDAFVFAFQPGTANNNVDTITDFKNVNIPSNNADKIWLDDAVFTTLSKGALGSSFGTFINYDSGTKGLFYDPLGGGSTTETGSTLKIATLGGFSVAPVAGDFVVF